VPKIRTHRGTAKRVKVSANGKVTHRHQFTGCGHILSKKSRKRKRHARKDAAVFSGDLKRFGPQIPYLLH
jgi:large subunit ribosomal protein L35